MKFNSDSYDTDFEISYEGNKILIKNDGPDGERLYINDELQDQNFEPYDGYLVGHIDDGTEDKGRIEVYLGGPQTSNCIIYADEKLIYSSLMAKPIDREKQKKDEKGDRRQNLLLPFVVIILIAACMVFLIPKGGESPPKDQASSIISNEEEDDAGNRELVERQPSEEEGKLSEVIEVNYAWNYGDGQWTYQMKFPREAYEYYKKIDRTKIRNYSYYVTDSSDDEYLAKLADKFKEEAEKENYSDLDMVNNIILFVQNLNYLDDKVGTGYDEYPKFPLETLADQGGDCEDSAILLASLLRELGYGTVLLQFSDHMAVGVKGEESIPGSYYEVDGVRYYYVETTSSGWEIGEVPELMQNQPARVLSLTK